MINIRKNIIVVDDQIKTSQIMRCAVNNRGNKFNIIFNNNPYKTYSYSRIKVKWLTNPVVFNPQHCHIYHKNRQLYPLSYIATFQHGRHQ